jgi:hypothetical protein
MDRGSAEWATKNYRLTVGAIYFTSFEVMDWIPETDALHLLGKTGNAEAFGLNNTEARNADLGSEPV